MRQACPHPKMTTARNEAMSPKKKDAEKLMPPKGCAAAQKELLEALSLPGADVGGRYQSWEGGQKALQGLGFKRVSQREAPDDREWLAAWEGRDPEGEDPPLPESFPAKKRIFELWAHDAGVLVSINSYQGAFVDEQGTPTSSLKSDDRFDESAHVVNAIRVNYQLRVMESQWETASKRLDLLGGSRGALRAMGEGSWVACGDWDPINGGPSLKEGLRRLAQAGPMLPLERWEPAFFYVEQELFSSAPSSSWAAESDQLKKRFERRLARDMESWLGELPGPARQAIEAGQRRAARRQEPIDSGWNGYIGRALAEKGLDAAPPSDVETMVEWGRRLRQPERGWPERMELTIGVNFLHALAAADLSEKVESQWASRMRDLGEEALRRMLGTPDPRGDQPWGVAARKLGESIGGMLGGEDEGLLEVWARQGWGRDGEMGKAARAALDGMLGLGGKGWQTRGLLDQMSRAMMKANEAGWDWAANRQEKAIEVIGEIGEKLEQAGLEGAQARWRAIGERWALGAADERRAEPARRKAAL